MPSVAYVIESVDRSELPEGKDWLYVVDSEGRPTFLVANGARIEWSCETSLQILSLIAEDLRAKVA